MSRGPFATMLLLTPGAALAHGGEALFVGFLANLLFLPAAGIASHYIARRRQRPSRFYLVLLATVAVWLIAVLGAFGDAGWSSQVGLALWIALAPVVIWLFLLPKRNAQDAHRDANAP
jgi:peptidoglycan/LPS O-acetylase OafA/YrhL